MTRRQDEQGPAAAKPSPVPVRAIVFLSFAAFASSANMRMIDPILPQIAREFAVTTGTAGIVVAAFAVAYGVFQLVFGPIGDRRGKYRVIMWASFLCAIATAAGTFAGSLTALTLLRIAAAAATAALIPLAMAWIGDTVAYEQRQAVLSRFMSGTVLGLIFGPVIAGMVAEQLDWRAAIAAMSLFYLIAGLALAFEMQVNPATRARGPAGDAGLRATMAAAGALLGGTWAPTVLIAVFIEGMAFHFGFGFIGADLVQRFGLGFAAAGIILTAFGCGGLAFSLSAHAMVARLGERGLAAGGGALMGAAFLTLALFRFLWVVPLCLAMIGYGFFMLHSTLQTNATQMAPDLRGTAVSVFSAMLFLGQAAGMGLATLLYDSTGIAPLELGAAIALPLIAFWFRSRLARRPAPI